VIAGSEAMLEPTEHGTMGTWQNLRFYPDHLAISEGDTIIFSFRTSDTHNVVFMPKGVKPAVHYIPSLSDPKRLMVNPLALAAIGGQHFDGSAPVSSGLINAISGMPKEWRVTLATPGIWTYVCTPYSTVVPMAGAVGMVGRIEVRKAGSTLPLSPEEVTSAADKAVAVDIAADEAADVAARKITSKAGPKGSTVWTMNAGYTTASSGERMRFGASDLTIKVGDIVEWVAKGGYVPHNVYFFSGGDEMPMTIKEGNILYVNQDVEKAVGSQVYDGTGVRSSGFIGEGPGRTKTYRLTFTKVGHYEYICIPHDEMGMMAYITVTE
jgi:plastocyanin